MGLGGPQRSNREDKVDFGRPYWGPSGSLLGSFAFLLDHFGSVFYQRLTRHVYGRRFGSKMRASGGGECVFSV